MPSSVAAAGSKAAARFAGKISEERLGECTSGSYNRIGPFDANTSVCESELLLTGIRRIQDPRRSARLAGFSH